MIFRVFLIVILISMNGCAVAPKDVTGQKFVGDDEFKTASLVKEGLSYAQSQKFVDAEFSLERAKYISPDAKIIQFNLGVVLLFQERNDEALEILSSLYESDRLNPAYRVWYARALVANGQYSAGLSLLIEGEEAALEKKEWSVASLFSQAESNIYFNAGYEVEALCASSRSLGQLQSPDTIYHYGRYLTALGFITSAKKLIEDFLIVNFAAVTKPIKYQEALISYEATSYDDAINYAKESFILPPNDEQFENKAKALLLLSQRKLEMEKLGQDEAEQVAMSLSGESLYLPKSILFDLESTKKSANSRLPSFTDLYNRALEFFRKS